MLGPPILRNFSTTASCSKKSLPQRIVKRMIVPPQNACVKSGWQLWYSHLKNNTKDRLSQLQKQIMEEVKVPGTMENELLMGEINQWHFYNASASIKTPTLLLHGYAAASMGFHRNFTGLSSRIQNLYAIDLLANGLSPESSQPLVVSCGKPLPMKAEFSNDRFKIPYTLEYLHQKSFIQQLEDYYLNSIEQWRIDNKLNKINIVAHSFGGYLSTKYAIKYPHAVERLCLVSPLGVERNTHSVNNHWCSNTWYDLNYEDPGSKYYMRRMRDIPSTVFQSQVKLLRLLGPLGAKLCWNYINAAYSRVKNEKYKEYVFELFYGKEGVTQTAMDIFTNLFTRQLLAKDPLMDGLQHLHVDRLMLAYGEHDWMNKYAGVIMAKEFNHLRRKSDAATYTVISSSGHNMFLDNPDEFNEKVINFLK